MCLLNFMNIVPYTRTAYYYETDQMSIIHHSNYIRWMEEARLDLLDQIGLNYKSLEESNLLIPVLSVSCDYKTLVRFQDTVVIYTKLEQFKGLRFSLSYEIRSKDEKTIHAIGTSSHCFLDKNFKPVHLKKNYPTIYKTLSDILCSTQS